MGYNEIQRAQGLDLAKYKNKKVSRFTYKVTNYEGYEGEVYANLLVWRDKVVGGQTFAPKTSMALCTDLPIINKINHKKSFPGREAFFMKAVSIRSNHQNI